ncbi:MAG: hypothetical protein ACE5K8_00965 [Candidatus Zixiibacteriota bacterium]
MAEEVQKKGLSKGCLIVLIVVGALVLLLVVVGIVRYVKKDDFARYGAATLVNTVKSELQENPVEGVDTVQVNAVADAFLEKLNQAELDYNKYGRFMQSIQSIPSDEKVDSAEAEAFIQAMIEYFPELEQMLPVEEIEDTTTAEDSVLTE